MPWHAIRVCYGRGWKVSLSSLNCIKLFKPWQILCYLFVIQRNGGKKELLDLLMQSLVAIGPTSTYELIYYPRSYFFCISLIIIMLRLRNDNDSTRSAEAVKYYLHVSVWLNLCGAIELQALIPVTKYVVSIVDRHCIFCSSEDHSWIRVWLPAQNSQGIFIMV